MNFPFKTGIIHNKIRISSYFNFFMQLKTECLLGYKFIITNDGSAQRKTNSLTSILTQNFQLTHVDYDRNEIVIPW